MGLREKRRQAIIDAAVKSGEVTRKAKIAEGLSVPSEDRIRFSWFSFFRRTDYTLQNSELIFSAVSRISNALSAMPVRLCRNDVPINLLADESPLAKKLNYLVGVMPSTGMTSCNFIKTMEACRCTAGVNYGLKVYNKRGELDRIDVLDPARVTPMKENETGELWYRIMPELPGNEFYVHGFYMITVPFLSTNGYASVSPVAVLFNTLKYNDAIMEFSAEQLKKGVNAAVVLEAPTQLGPTQREQAINDFMDTYRKTAGNILLLESGIQAKSLGTSPVDPKLFEVEKITRSKVATVYNIPPHLMGDYSDTSYGSQEQEMLEFLQLTMLPIVTAYEQELNIKLLTPELVDKGYGFRFNIDAILRADAATRAEVASKQIRNSIKLVDEVRRSNGDAPLPNGMGSHPFISQDLATVEYTVNTKPRVLAAGKVDYNTGRDITNERSKQNDAV